MAGFPNVPFAPGVPPLLRAPNFTQLVVSLLEGDALAVLSQFLQRPWGLYLNGLPVIVAESVRALDFRHDAEISDYPIEGGSFESYNKVQRPYQGRIRFMMGGSEDDRRALILSVVQAQASLDLYDLVMPEFVYTSVNVTHYDFRRTAENGLGLLTVDVHCEQVREDAIAEFTQTQSPSGANQSNSGTVQTVTVSPASLRDNVQFFGAIT